MERESTEPNAEQRQPEVVRQLSDRIFELSDGSFAILGVDATTDMDPDLPPDAARADYERTVVIPRESLVEAKQQIPEE